MWVNSDSPLPTGSLLYSPRRVDPTELRAHEARSVGGVLYITLEPYEGVGNPTCAQLVRMGGNAHRHHYVWDSGSYARDGSPWAPDACSLWVVNHLGGRLHAQPSATARTRDGNVRFLFDFERAEDEVSRMRAAMTVAVAEESTADQLATEGSALAQLAVSPQQDEQVASIEGEWADLLVYGCHVAGQPVGIVAEMRHSPSVFAAPGTTADKTDDCLFEAACRGFSVAVLGLSGEEARAFARQMALQAEAMGAGGLVGGSSAQALRGQTFNGQALHQHLWRANIRSCIRHSLTGIDRGRPRLFAGLQGFYLNRAWPFDEGNRWTACESHAGRPIDYLLNLA